MGVPRHLPIKWVCVSTKPGQTTLARSVDFLFAGTDFDPRLRR